ncbi:RGD1564752 (predicted), isoform CRA_a [Rattus norvegicus]|uniref:RGD1564752 (Predicted), isoform CRA_a n=1 Tax=Rattus norvegicus TaxID=10116 RepID=A6J3S0_RAT|nr:RGD1564752 (predicted), isoform CRA_a [Rattus norvegicus]
MATSLILDAARSFPPPAIVLSPDNGRQPQKLRSPKATWREEDCPWQSQTGDSGTLESWMPLDSRVASQEHGL